MISTRSGSAGAVSRSSVKSSPWRILSPSSSRELEGEDTPRVQQRAGLALGPSYLFDPPLHIDLVKAECGRRGVREFHIGVLTEFANGLQIREGVGMLKR